MFGTSCNEKSNLVVLDV